MKMFVTAVPGAETVTFTGDDVLFAPKLSVTTATNA